MTAPSYDWTCQKCGNSNLAHAEACSKCGFAAYFKVKDLPVTSERIALTEEIDQKEIARAIWMFFPEAVPAFILMFYVPIWAVRLLGAGQLFRGFCLLVAEAVCGYAFIQGLRLGKKWVAYASMVVFILIAIYVHSVGQ